MSGDGWARRRPRALRAAQALFGRAIGIIAPLHARLALATNGLISPGLGPRPGIILETKGRKSGAPRRVVLTYLPDGDRIVLVASNYGRAGNPAWFANLVADPHVAVIRRNRREAYRARVAIGAEREALLRRTDDANFGVYSSYARRTAREIPVVILEREQLQATVSSTGST